MNRFIPLLAIVLLFCGFKNDRNRAAVQDVNPFGNLRFEHGPTDTIQLTAGFIKTGDINEESKSLFSLISRNSNSNFNKVKYAIEFTLPGYKKKFSAPCKDASFLRQLTGNGKSIKTIRISCVAYRFYFIDTDCNFFFIDKATIVE